MIGWHPKKKVTSIQIAHWLPVFNRRILVSSLLFFHTSFYFECTLCIYFSVASSSSCSPCSPSHFCASASKRTFRFISGCCAFTRCTWHCGANKIYHERFYGNQNGNMKEKKNLPKDFNEVVLLLI